MQREGLRVVDRSGRAIYLLATDGLFVVNGEGRVLRRWEAPGAATSIALAAV